MPIKYLTYVVKRAHWKLRMPVYGTWDKLRYKIFTDNVYGSKAKALAAAIRCRDDYLKGIDKLGILTAVNCPRCRSAANVSGIIGVRVSTQHKKYGSYRSWHSYGIIDGK